MTSVNRRTFLGAMAALTGAPWLTATGQEGPVEAVFHNGDIHTLDPKNPKATALAVRGRRIVAIGSEDDVAPMKAGAQRVVDLWGQTVIPGLNDSHLHFVRGSLSYNLDVRWDGVPSLKIALELLKEQAARTPPGQWVRVGGGWSEYQFAEKRMPTLEELNRAVPDVPAYVLHFYQSAMVNRAGLKALGLNRGSHALPGGVIKKDSAGNPTGMLLAMPLPATILAPEGKMPPLSNDDAKNSIRQFMRELNRLGMTSVIDPGGIGQPYPQMYGPLSEVAEAGQQTLRLGMYLLPPHDGGELGDFERWFKMVKVGGTNDWFRFVGGGELLLDKAQDWDLYTRPQVVLPQTLKKPMEAVVRQLVEHGWAFREHATYNPSISLYLDVLESASRSVPLGNVRWTLDHAEMCSERNLERVAALKGGIAIQHRAAFHGEYALRNFGPDALRAGPPVRRMLELGIPVGAGTDATRDTTYNPWVSIQWMVTGKSVGGTQLSGPDNLLEVEEAIRLYTSGSAWFSGEETQKGTLAVGRLADFAVLSQNVFKTHPDSLHQTEADLTVVGGSVVHAAQAFAQIAPPAIPVSPSWSPAAGAHPGYYRG